MYVDVCLYVCMSDDWERSINEVNKLKWDTISLFQRGGFKLYEKHFKETILETHDPYNTTE